MFSIQEASQAQSFLLTTSPQFLPGKGHTGTLAFFDKFKVISSGTIIYFTNPDLGCIPLPLKIDRGSILKFPIFSKVPSIIAYWNFSAIFSFSFFFNFFSSLSSFYYLFFFSSKYYFMREKSNSSNLSFSFSFSYTACEFSKLFKKWVEKFFI